ncbi:MAG: DUF952 domain-containing protein [Candidatus Binataceae bacterium]
MIFHILKRAEWDRAIACGSYTPESLAVEGFIHCSTAGQILGTANNFFRSQHGLAVLCIDERRLAAPLRFETPAGVGDPRAEIRFPHIHGPLNCAAAIEVVDFPGESDGTFRLPERLLAVIKSTL